MQRITRSEAKALGLKRYFSADPCAHGHVAERLVSNGRCLACDRAAKRSDLLQNGDHVRARKRYHYARNRESNQEAARRYRKENAAAISEREKKWRQDNPDLASERDRQYYWGNRERALVRLRRYKEQNPHVFRAGEARRRARKRNAVPIWFDEFHLFVWKEAADLVIKRRQATGTDWDADHMVPLSARQVSGLHVAENCQVIPTRLNQWKKNKMLLTEPLEWLKCI